MSLRWSINGRYTPGGKLIVPNDSLNVSDGYDPRKVLLGQPVGQIVNDPKGTETVPNAKYSFLDDTFNDDLIKKHDLDHIQPSHRVLYLEAIRLAQRCWQVMALITGRSSNKKMNVQLVQFQLKHAFCPRPTEFNNVVCVLLILCNFNNAGMHVRQNSYGRTQFYKASMAAK
jgi:hypothetical protein